jgi:hypothetical protein
LSLLVNGESGIRFTRAIATITRSRGMSGAEERLKSQSPPRADLPRSPATACALINSGPPRTGAAPRAASS